MDEDGWLDARKRHDDVDELEKGESRSKSAMRRLKEMARKKKKRGKKGDVSGTDLDETDDLTRRNRRELVLDLMGTEYETDTDLDTEGRLRKKAGFLVDNETDDVKMKKKRKKKKKVLFVISNSPIVHVPL